MAAEGSSGPAAPAAAATAEAAASTAAAATAAAALRRPNYSSTPVLIAPSDGAGGDKENGKPQQEEEREQHEGQDEETQAGTSAAGAGAGDDAAAAVANLPPALRARLMKRGILPKASEPGTAAAPAAAPSGGAAPAADGAPQQPPAAAAPAPAAPAAVAASSGPSPPEWFEAFDQNYKHPYWYNPSTGERSWTRPGAPAAAGAPAPAAAAVAAAPAPAVAHQGPQLPAGWASGVDPATGCTYYYNAAHGVTQWEPPGATAAGAAAAGRAGFERAEKFEGARPGYVFKKGPSGLGYYLDHGLKGSSATGSGRISSGADAAALHPRPSITSAPEPGAPRKTRQEQIAEAQVARNMALKRRGGGGGGGRGARRGDEFDPMDPSSYSDAPKGGWGSGLESSRK